MAGPFGSSQQPITLAEIELQVATLQKRTTDAERDVVQAERELSRAKGLRDAARRELDIWAAFAKTLKELR